jgi:hypothetical protein
MFGNPEGLTLYVCVTEQPKQTATPESANSPAHCRSVPLTSYTLGKALQ